MRNNFLLPVVYYFYMPALESKPAEIIEVLLGTDLFIQVPMRDEDIRLKAFYQRTLTAREAAVFGQEQTWQIFNSWQKLEEDHAKWHVPEEEVAELKKFKACYTLSEPVLV